MDPLSSVHNLNTKLRFRVQFTAPKWRYLRTIPVAANVPYIGQKLSVVAF